MLGTHIAYLILTSSLDTRRQGSEGSSALPTVTGPMSSELQASPGLPEAKAPLLPTSSRLLAAASVTLKDKPGAP